MYKAFREKNKHFLAFTLVLAGVALLSGSRRSILLMIIYFICYYQFMEPNKHSGKFLVRVFVAIGALFVAYYLMMHVDSLYRTIGNRVETLLGYYFRNQEADGSLYSRLNMLTLATRIIKAHPILGIGANNYKYATYYHTYSHNGYTEIMCSFGIVGIVVYYIPLVSMMLSSVKNWKKKLKDAIFPLSIFISFFICEIGGVSYFTYYNYCFLGFAAGFWFRNTKDELENNTIPGGN